MAEGAAGGGRISDEEILDMLKALNVPVTKNDIKSPTRDVIYRVFVCFLKDLQIDINSNELKTWEATGHIEESEYYDEPMKLILVSKIINSITSPSNLIISVRDIVDPKPKRTKKILYHIIVFWNFYIQKYARFTRIEESHRDEMRRAEDAIKDIEDMDKKIEDIRKTLQKLPDEDELRSRIQSKKGKLHQYEKKKETLVEQYNDVKREIARINEGLAENETKKAEARKMINDLDSKLVSSPERIPSEIRALKEKIKAEDDKIRLRESQLKKINKELETALKAENTMDEAKRMFEESNAEAEKLKGTVQSLVSHDQKLKREKEEVSKLEQEIQRKRESVEFWRQAALKAEEQKTIMEDRLKAQQKVELEENEKIQTLNEDFRRTIQEIDVVSDVIIELDTKIKIKKKEYEEKIDKYAAEIQATCSSFKGDTDSIKEAIKNMVCED